jgi:hypothetical protein
MPESTCGPSGSFSMVSVNCVVIVAESQFYFNEKSRSVDLKHKQFFTQNWWSILCFLAITKKRDICAFILLIACVPAIVCIDYNFAFFVGKFHKFMFYCLLAENSRSLYMHFIIVLQNVCLEEPHLRPLVLKSLVKRYGIQDQLR